MAIAQGPSLIIKMADRSKLESIAARHLRALIAAHASNDQDAIEKAHRELGAALEYILQDCVEYETRCEWEYWCDGMIIKDVIIKSPTHIALVGLAIYGPGGSNWMAPFEAEFTLGVAEDSLRTCRMRFGEKDSDGGIVKTPSSPSAPIRDRVVTKRPRRPEEWWLS